LTSISAAWLAPAAAAASATPSARAAMIRFIVLSFLRKRLHVPLQG
jgi:hypothetical protein